MGAVEVHTPAGGPAVRRMTCESCATVVEEEASAGRVSLGLPLWLRAETRHGELVALNEAHLEYIETYVAGTLRKERGDGTGLRNQSVISRLPRWVKSAKNREEVLKAISRARSRLS
ncbi:MAG TPA: hypothetical protein VIO94_15400 [Phenylobacterium sp.]